MHKITMLGTGLIGASYTQSLHGQRRRDRVTVVYSRRAERARQFAADWDIPRWTADLAEAINDPQTDVVVIGLPNALHEEAVRLAAEAGKAVLCTKPLGRDAAEARRILALVEAAGVPHGYLEDLAYTPKTLKALRSIQNGALGRVLWARSRGAHSGPHSDWFWDKAQSGGGAIVDMGCHCIEVSRNFIGKEVRPEAVMCWAATQVHPIEAEDSAVGLVRYASGAIGQFEVSWAVRGGMDLRDEVTGTAGTLWLNHWQRTGYELFTSVGEGGYVAEKGEGDTGWLFTSVGEGGYVAEKSEGDTGWLFPVGDEDSALGMSAMFTDMLDALDKGEPPMETFYDGYVVNAIMDAAYRSTRSGQWEPVVLEDWRGADASDAGVKLTDYDDRHFLIKREVMADGQVRLILKDKVSGQVTQRVEDGR